MVTLMENISIKVPNVQSSKGNEDLNFFQNKTAEKVIFWQKPKKWKENFCFSAYFEKLPYFMVFFSLIEITFYCAANDRLKRALMYDSERKVEIWRFVTYMLVHTEPVHLSLNLVVQGMLGIPLEGEQGSVRCAAVYLGGGLAGALGATLSPELSLVAGASAGIYALLISHLPNTVLNKDTIKYAKYRVIIIIVLSAADVIYLIYHIQYYNNERPKIGWVAHASGAAAGLLLGFLIFKGNCECQRKFQVISCTLLLCVFTLGVSRLIYSDYFMSLLS